MRIKKSLNEYIYQLDDVMQNNILAAEFFSEHFINWEPNTDISYFESFVGDGLKRELILDLEGLNESDIDEEFMETYLIPAIKEVDVNEYLNNEYLKTVQFKNTKRGKYVINKLTYHAYELFPLDDVIIDENTYLETSQIGYFKQEVTYPYLGTSDSVWMSINYNEIKTMEKHINKAKGRVLVLGLGMGYFPFMISLKDEVKKVIILEKDVTIIDLFSETLFPYFKNKDKFEIINVDAFKYLSNKQNEAKYDMVFADIWHDANDGLLPFLKLKQLEGKINKPFMYWIDTSLFAMVRRCILTILVEHLENDNPRYDIARDEMDKAINYIYLKIKDLSLNSKEDVHDLLSESSIHQLLIK